MMDDDDDEDPARLLPTHVQMLVIIPGSGSSRRSFSSGWLLFNQCPARYTFLLYIIILPIIIELLLFFLMLMMKEKYENPLHAELIGIIKEVSWVLQ